MHGSFGDWRGIDFYCNLRSVFSLLVWRVVFIRSALPDFVLFPFVCGRLCPASPVSWHETTPVFLLWKLLSSFFFFEFCGTLFFFFVDFGIFLESFQRLLLLKSTVFRCSSLIYAYFWNLFDFCVPLFLFLLLWIVWFPQTFFLPPCSLSFALQTSSLSHLPPLISPHHIVFDFCRPLLHLVRLLLLRLLWFMQSPVTPVKLRRRKINCNSYPPKKKKKKICQIDLCDNFGKQPQHWRCTWDSRKNATYQT